MDPILDALTRSDGVAARLRQLREDAGLQAKDIAEATGFYPSKVSRLENAKQTPTESDVRRWVAACGASTDVADEILAILASAHVERRAWRLRMRRGQANVQADYNKLTAEASLVRHFQMTAFPGLIQTPEYARAMFLEMVRLHGLEVDDVDAAIATRLERQKYLTMPGKRFEFLLAEPVLRWVLCAPDVMRGQLFWLNAVMAMPSVRFGVVPLGVRLRAIPQNSVVLYAGEQLVASVETFAGASEYRGEDAEAYSAAVDRLWEDAIEDEAELRALIAAAIDALPAS